MPTVFAIQIRARNRAVPVHGSVRRSALGRPRIRRSPTPLGRRARNPWRPVGGAWLGSGLVRGRLRRGLGVPVDVRQQADEPRNEIFVDGDAGLGNLRIRLQRQWRKVDQ